MFQSHAFAVVATVYFIIGFVGFITFMYIVDALPKINIKSFLIRLFNNWFIVNAATIAAFSLLTLAIIQTVDVVYSIYRLNFEYELLTRSQEPTIDSRRGNDTNTHEPSNAVKIGCS